MMVDRNSSPPIHQRKFAMGRTLICETLICGGCEDVLIVFDAAESGNRKRFTRNLPQRTYFTIVTSGSRRAAEFLSRKMVVLGWVRRIDAGASGVIGPSKQDLTACAFLPS